MATIYCEEEYPADYGFNDSVYRRCDTLANTVIDGRVAENTGVTTAVFEDSDASSSTGNAVTLALEACNKTIIVPYFSFLKLIGWRKLSSTIALHEPLAKKVFNFAYPLLAFVMLMITFAQQVMWCFDRSMVYNAESNGSFVFIECSDNLASSFVIPDMIILSSYLLGLYTFRYAYPEHLAALIEKVFIHYAAVQGKNSQKSLLFSLRMLLFIGVLLLIFTLIVNVLRVNSFQLLGRDTYISWFSSYNLTSLNELYSMGNRPPEEILILRIFFLIINLVGLTLTDFFYIATVINYAVQCQLIIYAINATVDKFCNKHVQVDDAVKEIKSLQDFLKVLNGKFSSLVSLQLFVFIGATITIFCETRPLSNREVLAIVTGVCGIFEWCSYIVVVVIQALRVTNACDRIKRLGLEIRTRPFIYSKTQQLELDSLLLYTSSITIDARLVHIPMKPLFVTPVLFAMAITWRAFSSDRRIDAIKWL